MRPPLSQIFSLLPPLLPLHTLPPPHATCTHTPPNPPTAYNGYGISTTPLLYTLRHTLIRHTKAQTIQGQSVLALPEKTEEMVPGRVGGLSGAVVLL